MNLALDIAEIGRIAEQLAPLCDGDAELLHDMMTGETNVDRVVSRLHEQVARDDEMLAGITERAASIRERKTRIETRRDTFKAAIGKVLRAARLPRLELPEVTYSVRDGKSKLEVVDVLAVPLELCRTKAEPDKGAINEAFGEADQIPNWLTRTPATDVVTARTK